MINMDNSDLPHPGKWLVTQRAIEAANHVHYSGQMPDPPMGVSLGRWRAMINQILKNGEPLQR